MDKELINRVLVQMYHDFQCRDLTALEELLKSIPEASLIGYLRDGNE